MKHKKMSMLLLTAIVSLSSFPSFANTTTFACNYTTYTEQDGAHKVTKKFELNFISDAKTKKTYTLGNGGSTEVAKFEYSEHIVFAEVTALGSFMTTTIDKSMNSVHSRNTVMFGKLIASQYFGKCVLK